MRVPPPSDSSVLGLLWRVVRIREAKVGGREPETVRLRKDVLNSSSTTPSLQLGSVVTLSIEPAIASRVQGPMQVVLVCITRAPPQARAKTTLVYWQKPMANIEPYREQLGRLCLDPSQRTKSKKKKKKEKKKERKMIFIQK